MHTDRCGNTSGQNCHTKGSSKETKIQEFMYRDTANVGHEMYDYTRGNWSHRNSNKRFKEKLEATPGKHSIDSLQKTAILGTSHTIRKVLQSESLYLSDREHRWFKRSAREKWPVTRDNIIT
jgi:hypothetical protein